MFIPHSTETALLLIVVSMLCWASWPNLLRALPQWRLEFFYVDYTLGFLLTVLLIGATAGSAGGFGLDFLDRFATAGMRRPASRYSLDSFGILAISFCSTAS